MTWKQIKTRVNAWYWYISYKSVNKMTLSNVLSIQSLVTGTGLSYSFQKKNVWLNDFWVLCSFAFETSAQSSGVICTWYGGRVHDVINIVAHWVKNLVNYACDTNSWGSILITDTGVDCCMTGLILLVTGEGVWWKSGEWCVWMMPSLWSWIWGDIWWP